MGGVLCVGMVGVRQRVQDLLSFPPLLLSPHPRHWRPPPLPALVVVALVYQTESVFFPFFLSEAASSHSLTPMSTILY